MAVAMSRSGRARMQRHYAKHRYTPGIDQQSPLEVIQAAVKQNVNYLQAGESYETYYKLLCNHSVSFQKLLNLLTTLKLTLLLNSNPIYTVEELGEFLRRKRIETKKSLELVSELSGCSATSLRDLERSTASSRTKLIFSVIEALNITLRVNELPTRSLPSAIMASKLESQLAVECV